jgi:hypothetical protein
MTLVNSTNTPAKGEPTHLTPDVDHLPVHGIVNLIIMRMDAHPQEFVKLNGSSTQTTQQLNMFNVWRQLIDGIKPHLNRKEKQMLNKALREVSLDAALTYALNKVLGK